MIAISSLTWRTIGEVVGDDDVGQAELPPQPAHEVQDLALDRDVEAGGRLVGDDQLRRQRQGPGHADPARLAAGQLVRIAAEEGARQPDQLEQAARLAVEVAVR